MPDQHRGHPPRGLAARAASWTGRFAAPGSRLRSRSRGRLLPSIGVVTFLLALLSVWNVDRQLRPIAVTFSSPGVRGLRYRLVKWLVDAAPAHRLRIRPERILDGDETLRRLESRTLTFSTVLGGFDLSRHKDLRQVAALHLEPLHLAVKEEIHDAVAQSLRSLKGKVVQLGMSPTGPAHVLGKEILSLAGLKVPTESEPGDFIAAPPTTKLIDERNRDRLPDALFLVSALPAPTIRQLVVEHRYRLVPLPFARAFWLGALGDVAGVPPGGAGDPLLKERIADSVIPAYTYQMDPAVPAVDLPTLGSRVLILTHRDTDPGVVERLLAALYDSHFARAFHPPLTPTFAEDVRELPWHPGALRYARRDEPVLTGALISNLSNTMQILIPVLTTVFCLRQWFQQRTRSRLEDDLETYLSETLQLESEALALGPELSPSDVPPLRNLQRELGRLKTEALAHLGKGALAGSGLMAQFLVHVNDLRAHLSSLILQAGAGADGAPAHSDPD